MQELDLSINPSLQRESNPQPARPARAACRAGGHEFASHAFASRCSIYDRGALALFGALEQGRPARLRRLDLGNTKVGDKCILALAQVLNENPRAAPRLEWLDLSSNALGVGAKRLLRDAASTHGRNGITLALASTRNSRVLAQAAPHLQRNEEAMMSAGLNRGAGPGSVPVFAPKPPGPRRDVSHRRGLVA